MNQKIELLEARDAALAVIKKIDVASTKLSDARLMGVFDMFGGGLLVSLLKRNNIENYNVLVQEIQDALELLKKELNDLGATLPQTINDSGMERFFDVWFDNIFTDLMVQSKINEAKHELASLRTSVVQLIARLDRELGKFR